MSSVRVYALEFEVQGFKRFSKWAGTCFTLYTPGINMETQMRAYIYIYRYTCGLSFISSD